MALKARFGGQPWTTWPEAFRGWEPGLRARLPDSVRLDVDRHAFYQYLFFGQWERLRRYAAARGVGIIGDVPDLRRPRQRRHLAEPLGVPGWTSGGARWRSPACPPTTSRAPASSGATRSTTGTTWPRPATTGGSTVSGRRSRSTTSSGWTTSAGFENYWEIPAGATDAREGRWRKGPGLQFFRAVQTALPSARIIAEDLGYIGPGCRRPAARGGPAGDEDPPVRLRARREQRKPPAFLHPGQRRVHGHPRQQHDPRLA
jgi:4-alpha-glucanotransferase